MFSLSRAILLLRHTDIDLLLVKLTIVESNSSARSWSAICRAPIFLTTDVVGEMKFPRRATNIRFMYVCFIIDVGKSRSKSWGALCYNLSDAFMIIYLLILCHYNPMAWRPHEWQTTIPRRRPRNTSEGGERWEGRKLRIRENALRQRRRFHPMCWGVIR